MEGLTQWSSLHTELAQGGHFGLCDELLLMLKGMSLPGYGLAIVRYAEGWTLDRSGHWREAVRAYEESLTLFDGQELLLAAQILNQIGSLHQDQGDWASAEDAYGRALAAVTDDHNRGLVLNNLGGLNHLRNRPEDARDCFERAKTILAATQDRFNYAAACVGLGGVLRDEGRLQDSADQLAEAVLAFRDLGNVKGLATAVAALALTYHCAGHLPEAGTNYRTALDLYLSVGDRIGTAKTLANLALLGVAAGNRAESIGYLEQALAEYEEIGDRHGAEKARANLDRLTAGEP
jgi:tetratricopeptide (TPR) repeat protein